MKSRVTATVILLALTASCGESTSPDVVPAGFRIGGDISFLQEIEEHGGAYSDTDGEKDLLLLLEEHGFNSIRLRLWHTPEGSYNTLERVRAMATRVQAAGLDLLLDFHYSDWWADAGSQGKPAAWGGLAFDVLVDSVYRYSQAAFLRALRQTVQDVPGGRGAGVFYWAPEWIAVEGVPSAWENATLFNFGGQMLSSMEAFTGGG